jgi:hypothetical protein
MDACGLLRMTATASVACPCGRETQVYSIVDSHRERDGRDETHYLGASKPKRPNMTKKDEKNCIRYSIKLLSIIDKSQYLISLMA